MKLLLTLSLVAMYSGCALEQPTQPLPPEFFHQPSQAVSLKIGNQYFYWYSGIDTLLRASVDWGETVTIIDTITISNIKWYKYDTDEMRRADSLKLYYYYNDSIVIELDYSLHKGDHLLFKGVPSTIDTIYPQFLWKSTEMVFEGKGVSISGDSAVYFKYATRIGLLHSSIRIGSSVDVAIFAAGRIDGMVYGGADSIYLGPSHSKNNL